jgi:FkbM family methyltransferase
MEDLYFNRRANFTRWIVETGGLREAFVVVDVGVQGGENVRWHLLGDYLVIHGFDPIEDQIRLLKLRNAGRTNRHYHWMAAGNEDGEREFYFNRSNPTSSSFYPQGEDRFHSGERTESATRVPIRRLDSLLAQGVIPAADFLKVDVEGFEKDVFDGARQLLAGVVGVETETNFGISPSYPDSHFGTLHQILLEHHLLVFDIGYNRIPRASFQTALKRGGLPAVADTSSVGKLSTFNALFLRDFIDEADKPQNYRKMPPTPTVDKLLKAMVIYELHGLNDVAVDTAERFRERIGERLDVDRAIGLLADPDCRGTFSVEYGMDHAAAIQTLRAMRASKSWRVTAPLRWFGTLARKLR